jgi:hypothetical protein
VVYNFEIGKKIKLLMEYKNITKLLMEYKNITQKVSFRNVHSQHGCLGENVTSYLNTRTVQEKLSKDNVVTELNMEKIHIQIMLSDVG